MWAFVLTCGVPRAAISVDEKADECQGHPARS